MPFWKWIESIFIPTGTWGDFFLGLWVSLTDKAVSIGQWIWDNYIKPFEFFIKKIY